MEQELGPFELENQYLRLRPDSSVEVLDGGEAFWGKLMAGELGDFHHEYLVTSLTFDKDWPSWENHVNGDEIVFLLSGRVEFLLELAGGTASLVVDKPGQYVVVPRDTWHTARTDVATTMLFITAGEGTLVRPVGEQGEGHDT